MPTVSSGGRSLGAVPSTGICPFVILKFLMTEGVSSVSLIGCVAHYMPIVTAARSSFDLVSRAEPELNSE